MKHLHPRDVRTVDRIIFDGLQRQFYFGRTQNRFTIDGRRDRLDLCVLDPAEVQLTSEMVEHLWPSCPRGFTVGVDVQTGDVYLASFKGNDGNTTMYLWDSMGFRDESFTRPKLPAEFLSASALEVLTASKRPVRVYVEPYALVDFIERDIGYNELARHVAFEFRFGDQWVVVHGDQYQVRSPWTTSVNGTPRDDAG